MEIKIVISDPKTGKSYQKIIKDADAKRFIGLKISDVVKGEIINLSGYEFEVTGGSDYAGFPMRKDVSGIMRKKILAVEGVGINKEGKGIKQRKTVAGNTVHDRTSQVNLKVVKQGKALLGEEKEAGSAEAESGAGEQKAEQKESPKEEKKEEAKEDSKQEEKKQSEEKADSTKEADK